MPRMPLKLQKRSEKAKIFLYYMHNSKKEVIMTELKGADRFDPEVFKLLKLTGADDMMSQVLEITLKTMIPMLEAEVPDFPSEEYIERIMQKVDIDSMLYQSAPLYSRYYTKEEIAGLIAFNETPLGRKKIGEAPQVLQEFIAANQAWLEATLKDTDSLSLKAGFNMYENEINKLFNMMGLDFSAIASQMLEECIKNAQEQNPDVPESEITSFRDMFRKNMDIEILRNLYVTVYSRHYTLEEILGLIKFYESPLGRKSIQVDQKIFQETQAVTEAYYKSLAKEIFEELMEENS
jgi:hypothetical protein